MKYSEFRKRLARQGAVFKAAKGSHFRVYLNGRQSIFPDHPRNLGWTGVSVRFCGFLARRDDDADCTLLGEATPPESRKSVQSRP